MLKYIRLSIFAALAIFLFRFNYASAATFYLEPASGNIIKGCNTTIRVKMSTAGISSNGAQAYVDYTSLGGGSIGMSGGGIFSTYGTPPGIPAGTVGIFGYGGVVNGNAINFANVNVRSSVNGPLTLVLRYNAGDITSKIAEHPSSENILTGVTGGTYNVIDGYCETVPPYLTNMNPVPDKPNHPVGQDITFDIRDDSSGLNMSTFIVTVKQNNIELPINVTKTAHGTDDKWYSIDINPVNDLTPELKVVVTVSASDKASNMMSRTYQFNDLTCAQLGCQAVPASTTTCAGGGMATQCSDGVDNDNDGLIDMADPGCEDATDNNEFIFGDLQCPVCSTTASGGSGGGGFSLANLRFFLANRSVETAPGAAGMVETLIGLPFTVAADISGINDQVSGMNLTLGEKSYRMYFDNSLKLYAVDVADLSALGRLNGAVTVQHGAGAESVVQFSVSVLPKGKVSDTASGKAVARAGIVLEQLAAGNKYVNVSTITSDAAGAYGFVVPNGNYRLTVSADDYRTEHTSGFTVNNHLINRDFGLISTVNLLDANVPLGEKAGYLANLAASQAGKLLDSANDPVVEQAVQSTVAPIALGAALLATLPALSLLNLLSYLRFLFLQPVFLFGRKRRKKWGIVYNALNKLPIDLAIVRLIDSATNRIIQSRVTDSEGRYAFFADPGIYRIEVTKQGFIFPTKIMQNFKEDTTFLDIYHGEAIHVDDRYVAITANIPLDPAEAPEKTPSRLIWEQRLRDVQRFIASLSIAAGLLSVIIMPTWWTIGLLILQIVLYYLFQRLGKAKKPKNWGFVYDAGDKKPINRVVARLFSKQFNKLVSTQVTDNNGRYAFMVGPNEYYITFDKTGYQKKTSPGIAIKEKNELIKVDAAMEKSGSAAPMTPAPPRPVAPPQMPAPRPPTVPPPTPPTPPSPPPVPPAPPQSPPPTEPTVYV